MSYAMDYSPIAAQAEQSARASFIRRTYGHLAGAVLAFVALELLLFGVLLPTPAARRDFLLPIFASPISRLLLFGAFMVVAWLADSWAKSEVSPGLQYLGLALYVVFEAIIFVPLLWVATDFIGDKTIIPTAGILTGAIFGGLTLVVFTTGKDFSFLGPVLCLASFLVLGLIIAACLCGFSLGLLFSFAVVALACGFILYDTSNVLHHYRTSQHVAAALALFASVALLFYYIVLILIQSSSRD